MITARAFAGKHYAVYGLARSGLATVEALIASGAEVIAWDAKEEARAKAPGGTRIGNLDEAVIGIRTELTALRDLVIKVNTKVGIAGFIGGLAGSGAIAVLIHYLPVH